MQLARRVSGGFHKFYILRGYFKFFNLNCKMLDKNVLEFSKFSYQISKQGILWQYFRSSKNYIPFLKFIIQKHTWCILHYHFFFLLLVKEVGMGEESFVWREVTKILYFPVQAVRKNIPILIDAERPREGLDDLLKLANYVVCSAKFPKVSALFSMKLLFKEIYDIIVLS